MEECTQAKQSADKASATVTSLRAAFDRSSSEFKTEMAKAQVRSSRLASRDAVLQAARSQAEREHARISEDFKVSVVGPQITSMTNSDLRIA